MVITATPVILFTCAVWVVVLLKETTVVVTLRWLEHVYVRTVSDTFDDCLGDRRAADKPESGIRVSLRRARIQYML